MTKRWITIWMAALLLGTTALRAAPVYSLPDTDIPESGFASFYFEAPTQSSQQCYGFFCTFKTWYTNGIALEATDSGYTLLATNAGDFTYFDFSDVDHSGTDGSFTLVANFDDNGNFIDGTVQILGRIADEGIDTKQTLMTANLVDFATDGYLIGFKTDNIVCNAAIAADCTLQESVYLSMEWNVDPVDLDDLAGVYVPYTGSLTTVPLPAPIWLLGSALGLMGFFNRRKTASA
jgi:hypothetical protein